MTNILLVEDNPANWDMPMRRLERRGYTVVLAVDGRQAVAKAASEQPDLILMDLNLPLLDGWGAMRAIRATPTGRAIPIIALTAHAMSSDREKALAAGCDDYHSKPIELPRLLAQMLALLNSRTPV